MLSSRRGWGLPRRSFPISAGGVLPLYWHALSGMNAISVLAYRLIATLVVMIALLMAFRRYRAYHRAIAAL